MPNFSSPASIQMDLDFLTFYQEILRNFQGTLKRILKKIKSEYVVSFFNWQSMLTQNFNSLAFTQTGIAKYWTFFQENFRIFQKILK
jgi:hypothetical protein